MQDITLQTSSITSELYLSNLCHAKIQYINKISENETNKHQDSTEISPRDCPKGYVVVLSFHFATLTGSRALPAGHENIPVYTSIH